MRVSYFGTFKPYYSTENYIAHAFRELGHTVECTEERELTCEKEAYNIVENFKPDLILFCKCRSYRFDPTRMMKSLQKRYLTTSWIFDPYVGFSGMQTRALMTRDRRPPFCLDLVYTTDGGHHDIYRGYGIETHTLRQGIHEPDAYLGKAYPLKEQIIFLGNRTSPFYDNRRKLYDDLTKRYKTKFKWYGEESIIRGDNLNNLLASVKIVVGDSLPGKHYWSNRIYEVLGRGGFLLHPEVEGLDKEFTPFKHFVPFERDNFDQLTELIDYFLIHDKERERIRLEGHKYCKENYTYKHRVQEFINLLNERKDNKRILE